LVDKGKQDSVVTSEAEEIIRIAKPTAEEETTKKDDDDDIVILAIDNSETEIGIMTQEYVGDNIAEILMIKYNGNQPALEQYNWKNPEIETLNNTIKAGIQKEYNEFMASSGNDPWWIEIKSYPFTSEKYLQIVTTSVVNPVHGTDGDMQSYNFSKKENRYITLEEVMAEWGFTEKILEENVKKLYEPDDPGSYISKVEPAGFLFCGNTEPYTVFLLEVTIDNPDAGDWKHFYAYEPNAKNKQLEKFYRLDSYNSLFDPYEMDQMDPPLYYGQLAAGSNLVDERFELIALIFRLAGHAEYAVSESDYAGWGDDYENYHRELSKFEKFKSHPAVAYAASRNISGSDVVKYAIHIKEDMSGLADDSDGLTGPFSDDWTLHTAAEFCSLALDFREQTKFSEFFSSNLPFYRALSEPFLNDDIVSGIDIDWWWTKVALRFADYTARLHNYRYIVSPSIHMACMNAWNSDTVYAAMVAIVGRSADHRGMSALLVHEYNHGFGTAAGIDAYMTKENFKNWVDGTKPNYAFYDDWPTIATEYMVRAYTILYFYDHGYDDIAALCMDNDKQFENFKYIEEVYGLVLELEGRKSAEPIAESKTLGTPLDPDFVKKGTHCYFNGNDFPQSYYTWAEYENGGGKYCLMVLVDAEDDGGALDALYLPGYGLPKIGRNRYDIYLQWTNLANQNETVELMFELESNKMKIFANATKGFKAGQNQPQIIDMPVSVYKDDSEYDRYYIPLYAVLNEIGGGAIENPFSTGETYIFSGTYKQSYTGFWETSDRGEYRTEVLINGKTHSISSYWRGLEIRPDGKFTESSRIYQDEGDWILTETTGRYMFWGRMLLLLYERESCWRGPEYTALVPIEIDEPAGGYVRGGYIESWDEDYLDIRNNMEPLYANLADFGYDASKPGKAQ